MGYYMRYVVTDDGPVSLELLETALKQASSQFAIQRSKEELGELRFGNDVYAIVQVNRSVDPIFSSELDELVEEVEEAGNGDKDTVLKALKTAKAIIAVQVLWGNRQTEETLSKLDPLWNWLISNRKGIVQADGEGYYANRKLILKVE